jgi:hypothetical protein
VGRALEAALQPLHGHGSIVLEPRDDQGCGRAEAVGDPAGLRPQILKEHVEVADGPERARERSQLIELRRHRVHI